MIRRDYLERSRKKLYEEIWGDSIVRVAKRYWLSDVGLKKLCDHNVIPTPPLP